MDLRPGYISLFVFASLLGCGGDPPTATPPGDSGASDVPVVDVPVVDVPVVDVPSIDAPQGDVPQGDVPQGDVPPIDVADTAVDLPIDVPADTGCDGDGACPAGQRCDAVTRACVECVRDEHCALGSVCADRRCVPGCSPSHGCPAGSTCCGAACVDTRTALPHCGACDMVCRVDRGTPACVGGLCTVGACSDGAGDCDGAAANGCETDVRTSTAHCGRCGAGCMPPSATGACVAGVCSVGACDAGRGDCDGAAANGCEVDTRTAPAHCGACGRACVAGQRCAAGACVTLESCGGIHAALPALPSGAYTIDPDGPGPDRPFEVYCEMSADGGGWTLALKADGNLPTFRYTSPLWINADTLNPSSTSLARVEAKFQSFSSVPFSALRLVFVEASGSPRALVISSPPRLSLRGTFNSGTFESTSAGRAAWLGLMSSPSLQRNCNREGFNNSGEGFSRVRIGILGNQDDNCSSPDSRIGFGGGDSACVASHASNASGNVAGCMSDNGDRDTRVFGYVFVR